MRVGCKRRIDTEQGLQRLAHDRETQEPGSVVCAVFARLEAVGRSTLVLFDLTKVGEKSDYCLEKCCHKFPWSVEPQIVIPPESM